MTESSSKGEAREPLDLAPETVADLEVRDTDPGGGLRPDPTAGTCECTDVNYCTWGCGAGSNVEMGC
ncbi:MAG: hypothetical protein L0I76_13105 [Pseudonocardia sp.]|nr:hypothetical protein [Pseudonocardia sp.]